MKQLARVALSLLLLFGGHAGAQQATTSDQVRERWNKDGVNVELLVGDPDQYDVRFVAQKN